MGRPLLVSAKVWAAIERLRPYERRKLSDEEWSKIKEDYYLVLGAGLARSLGGGDSFALDPRRPDEIL